MVQDIRLFKIKNITILVGIFIGTLFLITQKDISSLLYHFGGMIVPILILFPLFMLRMFGAGDIKLLSVVGLFLGTQAAIHIIIASIVIGGVLSLVKLVQNRNIKQRAAYFIQYIRGSSCGIRAGYYDAKSDNYTNAIHFSIAISVAVVLWLVFIGGIR